MFDRTLPRLVALALGVLVLLKLIFPEPPFDTKKKEKKDEAEAKRPGEETKPAESTEDSGADAGVAQDEAEPVVAEDRTTEEPVEERSQGETPVEDATAERPVTDAQAETPPPEMPTDEAPPTSPPIEAVEAPVPEMEEEPAPVERERRPPPTEEEREVESRPPEAVAAPLGPATIEKDIVDTATASGSFAAFGMALELTGIDATLRDQGPFMVFAPTDKAFAELETLDQLLDDTERLSWVLKNHIVPGHYIAADLAAVASLDAISGASLTIDTSEEPDILALNGVIHAINKVLIRKR
jgi:uncharacterized surface protein with fasciclin (FAS1) repeats